MNFESNLKEEKKSHGKASTGIPQLISYLGLRNHLRKVYPAILIIACVFVCIVFAVSHATLGVSNSSQPGGFASSLFNSVVIVLSAAVLAGAGVLTLSRGLSLKLAQLNRAIEEVSGGNMAARVILPGDDVGEIARRFNEMMEKINDCISREADEKRSMLAVVKAVDSSSDAIAITDSKRGSIYYNKRFLDIFGYSADELSRAGGPSLLYTDSKLAVEILKRIERGESWSGETEMRTSGGEVLQVGTRADAIRDEENNVTGRIEIYTDITQRKRGELLQSALYRIAEKASCAEDLHEFYSVIHEIVGELMYTGNFFIALYDDSSDVVSFPYFIDEEDTTPQPRKMKRGLTEYVLRTGAALLASRDDIQKLIDRGEMEVVGTLPVDWLGIPLKVGVKTLGVLAVQSYKESIRFGEREKDVLTFVSQHIASALNRKTSEQALKQSEEKYRTILESIEDGYYEVDLAGNLQFFNEPVSRILGYPPDELVGLNHRQYLDGDVAKDVFKGYNKVFETGVSARDLSYPVNKKSGEKGFVETSISLRRDAGGAPDGFRGIIRDVTERRHAQETLERDLRDFLTIVSTISEGDLTKRGVDGDNTLGRVIQSVNKMLDHFSLMLTEVKQIGLSVSSSATEILAASEQIAVGSQRQADEITNTSSAVEEMAASMSQVSRNAEASAEAARRALETAEHGDRAVTDTSEAMRRIDSAVQQTSEKMRLLGLRSSEISEIIDLINDIAAQTNLLALNAAIEAAHAGEAGLGFSVVAEEIRKLAERSARATRDVGNLIKTIQKETSEALTAMDAGMQEVKGGSQLAGQASRALQDISAAVRQSSELIEEISAASEEQARVTSNLAAAMQTISSITLETSAGAHETAQTIQSMVVLSEQLNKAISQFKVKDDFVHPFSYDLPSTRAGGRADGAGFARYSQGD
ncbi:MAG TPA: methyl-accepting chemotaxis protein [Blastocatellia bacterium]|nr:methyl-accepting chemotaxis protein [Blastocatellia bacterium]